MSKSRLQHGFTLAELAVVLVIVGLLLGGLLVPLSAQMDTRYRSDTAKALSDIREALIGFAIVNGRLPCPANGNVASGIANAGVESTTGSGTALACTGASGVLPWATLGLPEADAWNNRYTYRVTLNFARGIPQSSFGSGCTPTILPTTAAFALCTPGDISILTAATGGATIASGIPAVVISHGKNGYGAWNTSGNQNDFSSATADELDNKDDDINFVSNTSIDDQLVWISPSILMNRMIAAGKLP